VDFCDLKVYELRDSMSVDQGIGYDSVERCLVLRTNIGLVDVFAEDSRDRTKSAAAHRDVKK
jgi:hypothetical protein